MIKITYDSKYFNEAFTALKNEKYYNVLNKLSEIKFWVGLKNCESVLEVGCGIGINSANHENAIGTDVSKFAVNYCKKKGIKIAVMDVQNLGFKKNSFDGIICSHVLEHLENPLKALKEMQGVLTKGGKIMLCLPTSWMQTRKVDEHLFCWNEMEIKNLLKRAGFVNTFVIHYNFRAPLFSLYLPFNIWLIFSRIVGSLKKPNEFIIYACKN